MPRALITLVQQRVSFMRQKVEGPQQKTVEEVGPDCREGIKRVLQKMGSLSLEDASSIHGILADSLLVDADRKAILDLVDTKVDAEVDAEMYKSEMTHPENYQTEQCWQVYLTEMSIDKRLETMAIQLHVCGGHKLTEPSYADATSVAMCTGQCSRDDALAHTRRLKTFFHQIASHISPAVGPPKFPELHHSLETTHPDLWAQINSNGPIVPSKLCKSQASLTKARAVCRNSKRDNEATVHPRHSLHRHLQSPHLHSKMRIMGMLLANAHFTPI